jgi:hypothetical protein
MNRPKFLKMPLKPVKKQTLNETINAYETTVELPNNERPTTSDPFKIRQLAECAMPKSSGSSRNTTNKINTMKSANPSRP